MWIPLPTRFLSLAGLWMASLRRNISKCECFRSHFFFYTSFSSLTTSSFSFGNLKKDRLVELCRGFGLPHTGNMQTLRNRLREFSGSREEWNRYVQVLGFSVLP